MNNFKKNLLNTSTAQAAVELAVFGAILIFVIGTIVRSSLGFSYQQNQSLKAMRMAMTESYNASEAGNASHNNASVLFIEDRLTASSAKYGSIDRTPYILGGSGTHSKQLFLPIEANEPQNLRRTDMYINGKHFSMLAEGYKTMCLTEFETDCPSGYDEWAGPYAYAPLRNEPKVWESDCAIECPAQFRPPGCPCSANAPCPALPASCIDIDGNPIIPCPAAPCPPCAPIRHGCVEFRTTAANVPNLNGGSQDVPQWCDDAGAGTMCPDPLVGCPPVYNVSLECNFSADGRFDLDRDGVSDVDNSGASYPAYKDFSWQWYKVMAFDEAYPQGVQGAIQDEFGNITSIGITTTLYAGEGFIFQNPNDPVNPDMPQAKNIMVDVDGDLKKERIVEVTHTNYTGIPTTIKVIDYQEGDIDSSYNTRDYKNYASDPTNPLFKPRPGLTKHAKMYTQVNPGTYLLIEEGKLFSVTGDARQYVRQTQKKDQIDIVEREIQLSNNTRRFCLGGIPAGNVDGEANPVEACGNCFSSTNITLTCMDEGDLNALDINGNPLPRHPVIFVRSRIEAKHGRRWVTDTSSDDYVTFK